MKMCVLTTASTVNSAHCAWRLPAWRSTTSPLAARSARQRCNLQLQCNHRQYTVCTALGQAATSDITFHCNRRSMLTSSISSSLVLLSSTFQSAQASLIDEQQADDVFSKAGQSVVSIADYKVNGQQEEAEGTGSGFLWDTYGHVVTNYHVVAAAKQVNTANNTQIIRVGFVNSSGVTEEFPASIVGTDAQHDIAVLLIDAPQKSFVPVQVGMSAGLRTGQSVYAIGNPYGLSRTLTAGVVSGLNRAIPSPVGTKTYGAIQTDAAISSGNSGGPLLDSAGRVIGINTATFTRAGTGRSSGVNFALPIDLAMKVVPNLIVYGNAAGKGVKGI